MKITITATIEQGAVHAELVVPVRYVDDDSLTQDRRSDRLTRVNERVELAMDLLSNMMEPTIAHALTHLSR